MSDGFEWLDWVEPSGPFLAPPVLKSAFPQGLGTLDPSKRKALRQAYDEYREALEGEDPESDKFHAAWIDLVLRQGLEYDEDESGDNLKSADELPDSLAIQIAEHGVTLKPSYAVVDDQNGDKPMMLIQVYDQDVDLNDAVRGDGWASSPRERMVRLCRDTGTRLGLVTNGEHWLFVDAPVGAVSSFANWYARLLGPEPVLLQAFVVLLGIRRFFLAVDEQLPALIDKSVEYQDEVTAALGEQVRRAVEVLIQALDKADVDRNRELLKDVDPRELYEAGLTVMMRLVFLLSAEERELLLLGDERYEANYAVSTLRMQLRGEDDAILQRRWDAWSRLLAIFRAIYGGIEHETLRMPALGGSLFEPDRFPFLEGRDKDSNWKTDPAKPLPIDNQTVLLLLDAIQLFEGRTLSYRGLDIEQLGYVYEGLLDHTVKRAKEVTLELDATKNTKQPWVTLGELESAKLDGGKAVEKLLKERTGSSVSRVRNDLKKEVKPPQSVSLLTACHNDQSLHDQLNQYFHLIRTDSWGRPLVYPEGSFMVTTGEDRRQTGSHYTPTSLTEAIVKETLEPIVYIGPAEGKPKEKWQLKSPEELLDLKICDPAMGSGAFLVQVCRWLGERVVEAWGQAEETGKCVDIDGRVNRTDDGLEPMPRDAEERVVNARRLIAERCIYGVDMNRLAVELAKLSIWLVTMAKNRPFGFLDHNLRSGDSLLGIHDLNQLTALSIDPKGERQARLFGRSIQKAVDSAVDLRNQLRDIAVRDITDVETMEKLENQASSDVEQARCVANAFIGSVFASKNQNKAAEQAQRVAVLADDLVEGDFQAQNTLMSIARAGLVKDSANGVARRPFHWALEFSEVFAGDNGGFDAVVGNPPYMGGRLISGSFGDSYLRYLLLLVGGKGGQADICAHFLRRSFSLLKRNGCLGMLATNSISQGATLKLGLEPVVRDGGVLTWVVSSIPWPGDAAVFVTAFSLTNGPFLGKPFLNGVQQYKLAASLMEAALPVSREILKENTNLASKGFTLTGDGFLLSDAEFEQLKTKHPEELAIVKPHFNGKELYSMPQLRPTRHAINFEERSLDEAKNFPFLLARVERLVKPKRQHLKSKSVRERWWRYERSRPGLRETIENVERVIVKAHTSNTWAFVLVPSGFSFDQALIVIAVDTCSGLATLQSSIHEVWAKNNPSTMKGDTRYTVEDCFLTYPFQPDWTNNADLEELGKAYTECRQQLCLEKGIGLTKLYGEFNRADSRVSEIEKLRALHKDIDYAVMSGYGWGDIDLGHGFHAKEFSNRGGEVTYSIAPESKATVLFRLSDLNETRANSEMKQRELDSGAAEDTGRNTAVPDDAMRQNEMVLDDLNSQE